MLNPKEKNDMIRMCSKSCLKYYIQYNIVLMFDSILRNHYSVLKDIDLTCTVLYCIWRVAVSFGVLHLMGGLQAILLGNPLCILRKVFFITNCFYPTYLCKNAGDICIF